MHLCEASSSSMGGPNSVLESALRNSLRSVYALAARLKESSKASFTIGRYSRMHILPAGQDGNPTTPEPIQHMRDTPCSQAFHPATSSLYRGHFEYQGPA